MASNFNGYWRRLCRANAALDDDGNRMTISVSAFRVQLERAYQAGARDKAELVEALKNVGERDDGGLGALRDVLGIRNQ